jgi:hypothetical protein
MSVDSAKFYKTLLETKDKYTSTKTEKYSHLSKKHEDEMWFIISLMSPGGEIARSAGDFEIRGLAEIIPDTI